MRPGDTIAAQATPHGRGPRAVIRLSGPDTPRILSHILFHAPTASGAHRARLRLPTDAGEKLIPCLLLLFAAPRSYTGEHAAELHLPSNPALIDRILALLLSQEGVRLAEPGEFTARAFLNNRMTLEQAEGVQAVISARSAEELAAAQRLLAGDLGDAYRAAADELADLLALVEAAIDFTDQESVVPITPERFVHSLRNVLFGLDALAGPSASESPSSRPRIVLAGPPNAGKSTLFNALLGRDRAVVSETPGTTRDVLAETLDLPVSTWETRSIILVDLAGLDAALGDRSSLDAAAQLAARLEIERADAVIHCDPSGRFDPLPVDLSRTRVLRLRTKADLPQKAQLGEAEGQPAFLSICALDGWNLDALRRAIADLAWAGAVPACAIDAAVVPRHRRALADACDALRRALADAKPDERLPAFRAPEVIAGELRLALDALGAITGRVAPDDVLGRVFRFFCVGK